MHTATCKKGVKSPAYLPHQPKVLIHIGLHGMDLAEKRVFEAPQNLVDSAGHEHFNAQGVHVHGNKRTHEKGVGVHLVHHRLGRGGRLGVKVGKTLTTNSVISICDTICHLVGSLYVQDIKMSQ